MRKRSFTFHVLRWSFWGAVLVALVVCWLVMIRMPGRSFSGTPPPLTAAEQGMRAELVADVRKLGGEIGERNLIDWLTLRVRRVTRSSVTRAPQRGKPNRV